LDFEYEVFSSLKHVIALLLDYYI